MKKKKSFALELKKNRISNLNLLNHGIVGGIEITDSLTDTLVTTFPSTFQTQHCEETVTCETEYGGCNTNDTTKSLGAPPSFDDICDAIGSLVTC